jgi:hypothetical protein
MTGMTIETSNGDGATSPAPCRTQSADETPRNGRSSAGYADGGGAFAAIQKLTPGAPIDWP